MPHRRLLRILAAAAALPFASSAAPIVGIVDESSPDVQGLLTEFQGGTFAPTFDWLMGDVAVLEIGRAHV